MERLEEWSEALDTVITIAEANLELGDIEQGIAYYRRGVDLAVNHDMTKRGVELAFKMAGLLIDYRGLEAARPVFDEVRVYDNHSPETVERIADILFERGYRDEVPFTKKCWKWSRIELSLSRVFLLSTLWMVSWRKLLVWPVRSLLKAW